MNPIYAEKIHRINYLMAEMDALYHQAALKLGMADSTMRMLYALHDCGGRCPLTELCRRSGSTKQTVNSAIRSLEREGIVYLEPYRGRTKLVHLTEKGGSYVEQTVARLFAAEAAVFSTWTEPEIDDHIQYLARYLEDFRTQIPGLTAGETDSPQTPAASAPEENNNSASLAAAGQGGSDENTAL